MQARNGIETYVYMVRHQLDDNDGWGAKLDRYEKKTIRDTSTETLDWLDEYGFTAVSEDFEEQRRKLSDVVEGITGKLYDDGTMGNMEL